MTYYLYSLPPLEIILSAIGVLLLGLPVLPNQLYNDIFICPGLVNIPRMNRHIVDVHWIRHFVHTFEMVVIQLCEVEFKTLDRLLHGDDFRSDYAEYFQVLKVAVSVLPPGCHSDIYVAPH